LSAVDTFFGDGPEGAGGVFTGAGIDALAPDADGNGGYAALSALPVFFGGTNGPFGEGVFTGGGVDALSNYDALSAIPAYLAPNPVPGLPLPFAAPQENAAPEEKVALRTTSLPGGGTGTQSAQSFAPQAFTPPTLPQLPKVELPKVDPPANSGPKLNVSRLSEKFTPAGVGGIPILFGGGTAGVDNSIRGYGDALKKLGINGGGEDTGGESGGTP